MEAGRDRETLSASSVVTGSPLDGRAGASPTRVSSGGAQRLSDSVCPRQAEYKAFKAWLRTTSVVFQPGLNARQPSKESDKLVGRVFDGHK